MKHKVPKYLESKPGLASGKLVIKGTRIRITQVIQMLISGRTIEQIHSESWPWLTERKLSGAVEEALEFMNIPSPHDKASAQS